MFLVFPHVGHFIKLFVDNLLHCATHNLKYKSIQIIQKRKKHAGKQCKKIFAVNLDPQFSLAASTVVVASYKEMVFFFCGEKFICQQWLMLLLSMITYHPSFSSDLIILIHLLPQCQSASHRPNALP